MKPIMILCQKDTFLTETTLNNYYSTICSEYAIKTTQGLLKCHSHTLWTPGLGYHKATFDKDLSGWYKKIFFRTFFLYCASDYWYIKSNKRINLLCVFILSFILSIHGVRNSPLLWGNTYKKWQMFQVFSYMRMLIFKFLSCVLQSEWPQRFGRS